MNKRIGFMQGRLSKPVKNLIQAFPWEDWEKEFKIANEISVNLMEWTLDDYKFFENPIMNNIGREKIRDLRKRFKINIHSLTGDCFMQKPFWKATLEKRKILEDKFLYVCESCSSLGVKIIVVPLVDNGAIENSEQEDRLVEFFLDNVSIFKKLNLQIAFESDYFPLKLKKFINKFPENLFGINYDTGNSASLGFNSSEEFYEYGKRIINVHIKDRIFKGKTVPLTEGNADFRKIFKGLNDLGYKGNFILQTARAIDGNHSEIIKNYQQFVSKEFFGKFN